MKISKNGKQSIAWLCTMTLTISSVFGNTVFAGQDEEWITKGTHSYHDCLVDEDCLEEMAVLFEDAEFLEEQGLTEEEGQLEMLKEMVRIYDLFGEEPAQGWAYYADLAGIEIDGNLASASNADRNTEKATASNAQKATASNAENDSDGKLATSSDLPSGFAALKKAVKGEAPKYQDYYCTEIQDDLGLELADLEEDGHSASITFAPDKRPHIVITGEREVYGQIFANSCENEQFTFSLCGLDSQGQEVPGAVFERTARMWDLQDQNWYNNCGYNRWQAPTGTSQLRLTLSLSDGAVEKGFTFAGTPTVQENGNIEFQVSLNRNRHIEFSYPTADSFGGSSSDDGTNAVLTFKDFAVFSNELYGTCGHIEGNIAVGKVTNKQVDTSTNGNVLKLNADSSQVIYLKDPSQSLPITATQGSGAEIVLGSGAEIWVGTNGHGNKGDWYVNFPKTGKDTLVGTSSQVKHIVQEDDTDNGGFSIDIDRALDTLADYHPNDNANATTEERSVIIHCDQETTVVTVKAKDLEKEWLKLYGLDESKNLIINVDTEGVSTVNINAAVSLNGNGQLSDWKSIAGNIVWNFGSFSGKVNGKVINSGLLLVPNGDVELFANWNGCIAADRVSNSGAEIHKVSPVVPDPEPTTDTTTTTESTSSSTEDTTTTVTETSTETTTESTTSTGTTSTTTTEGTTSDTTTTKETTSATTTTKGTTSDTTTTKGTTSATTTTKGTTSATTTTKGTTSATTKGTTSATTTTKGTTSATTTTKGTTSATTTTKGTTSATTTTKGTTSATTTTKGTTSDTTTTKETTSATTTTKGTTSATTTTKGTTSATTTTKGTTSDTTTTKGTTSATTTTKGTTSATTTTKGTTSATTTTKGTTSDTTTTKETTSATTTTKGTTSATTTTKGTTSATTTTKGTTSDTTTTKGTTSATTTTKGTTSATTTTKGTTSATTTTKGTTSATTTTKGTTSATTKGTTSATTTTKGTTSATTTTKGTTSDTTTTKGTTSATTTTKGTTSATTTTKGTTSDTTTTKGTTSGTTTKGTTSATTTGTTTTTVTESSTETTTELTTSTGTSETTATTTTKRGDKTTSDKTTKETTQRTTVRTTAGSTTTTVTERSTETTSEATTTTGNSTTTTAETTGTTTTQATTTTRKGSSGGGGGGNGGRSSGGGGGTTPTVPIVDNPVPLGNVPVPDDPDMDLVLIDDPDVPLTGLPKTGDSSGTKLLVLALSLSALILQLKKQREENKDES